MSNLGWLFYKDYFKGLDYTDVAQEKNENLIKKKITNILNQSIETQEEAPIGNIQFSATTTYPGLILGSGNAHELPDVKGQAILGFSFDYTTGLPVIAGSSIKGVLRSAFKHPEYVVELLDSDIDIKELEKEIFDNGDIFFDAIVASNGKILGDDYITPHGDALKNPIPLRFIKVLPNVKFRFDFELKDGLLTKEEKAILFTNILSDLGVGAKTNVGYGKFNSDLVDKAKREIVELEEKRAKEKEEKENKEAAENEKKALESIDSNVEKIKLQIKDFGKNETKNIHDIISEYTLSDDDKKNLLNIIREKIGDKPKPKNKASIKWAIRIYELLGE